MNATKFVQTGEDRERNAIGVEPSDCYFDGERVKWRAKLGKMHCSERSHTD